MWIFLKLDFQRVFTLIILFGLVIIRWVTYSEIGFVNFDSAFNVIIAKQLAKGDFGLMFNHAAPFLHLVNSMLYWIFNSWHFLKLFHVLVNVYAIYLFANTFRVAFEWSFSEFTCYLIVFGTSLFAVFSSYYVSLEPLSLLLFAFILRIILSNYSHEKLNHLAFYSSIGLLVNYKFLPVVFPALLLSELIFNSIWKKVSLKLMLKAIVVFAGPIFLIMFIGYLNNKPLYVYPGSVYVHAVERSIHPAISVPHWNFDFSYYPRYFFEYEQPIMIPLLLIFFGFYIFRCTLKVEVKKMVFILVLFLLGMAVVQKAPRGLLFCYPLLYAFSMVAIFQFKNGRAKWAMISFFLIWNAYTLEVNVFRFSKSFYSSMANRINELGIYSVSITSSSLLLPFLNDHVNYRLLKVEREAVEDTNSCRLIDTYGAAAGVEGLLVLPKGVHYDTLAYYQEPTLDAPLLWLESSEYNGWSYEKTMEMRKKYSPGKILLVKINRH